MTPIKITYLKIENPFFYFDKDWITGDDYIMISRHVNEHVGRFNTVINEQILDLNRRKKDDTV